MREWEKKSTPDDIKPVPWICPKAVEFLSKIVKPGMRVLEHGSGGSTLWFTLRGCDVVTAENNPDWAIAVLRAKVWDQGSITMLYEWPTQPNDLGQFDIVFIDGDPRDSRKAPLLEAFSTYCKGGGWVVLDNYNISNTAREVDAVRDLGEEHLFNVDLTKINNTAMWRKWWA